MKTLSKSKGVKEEILGIVDKSFRREAKRQCEESLNEMSPMLIDDMIPDWEHDNLESK